MSRQNKVNKNNYTQAGRLTPDEMARETAHLREDASASRAREKVKAKQRPPSPQATAGQAVERESNRPRNARGESD